MENFVQGIGLFLCIGAILLVGLVFFAFRTLTRSTRRAANEVEDRVFGEEGTERPQYDDRDVTTAGGFGGIPSTGDRDLDRGREFDRDRDLDRGLAADERLDNIPYDRDIDDRDVERRRRDDDDDDVRSSGGFGA